MKFYRVRDDGSIGIQEISRDGFIDQDDFNKAVDFLYCEGYYDTIVEAREAIKKKSL